MAASLSPLLTLLSLLSGPWLELGQCAGLPDCPWRHEKRGGALGPGGERVDGRSARLLRDLAAAGGASQRRPTWRGVSHFFFTFNLLFWNLLSIKKE